MTGAPTLIWPAGWPLPQDAAPPYAARAAICRVCDVATEACPVKRLRARRPCQWRAYLRRPGTVCLGTTPPRWGPVAVHGHRNQVDPEIGLVPGTSDQREAGDGV